MIFRLRFDLKKSILKKVHINVRCTDEFDDKRLSFPPTPGGSLGGSPKKINMFLTVKKGVVDKNKTHDHVDHEKRVITQKKFCLAVRQNRTNTLL